MLLILRARSTIMTRNEMKYPFPDFHVDFAKTDQTPKLNVLNITGTLPEK